MQPLFCGNWGSTDASQSSPIFLRYLLGQADPSDFDRPSLLYGLFDFRQPFDQAAIHTTTETTDGNMASLRNHPNHHGVVHSLPYLSVGDEKDTIPTA